MGFEKDFGATRHAVASGEVELAVLHAGRADAPVVVFVHGYPDTHAVWLPTIARLVDGFRCVAYDVRGAGDSTAPATSEGYRMPHLVGDLVSVLDDTHADRVHLVGHDWGSVQCWQAVLQSADDERLRGRIASYTSISGPAAGHFAAWAKQCRRDGWAGRRRLARQLARSWYMAAFQVPVLPELVFRATLDGPEPIRKRVVPRGAAPTIATDAAHGLGLYRANLRGADGPPSALRTDLPIQLIVPLRDPYLGPALYDVLPRYCSDLTRHDLDTGHWAQRSRPDEVAALIGEFVSARP